MGDNDENVCDNKKTPPPKDIFGSQPSLFLDTLKSSADREANRSPSLDEAASMLRRGLGVLEEVTHAAGGKDTVEAHVQVHADDPDDGIIMLNNMLKHACIETMEKVWEGAAAPAGVDDSAVESALVHIRDEFLDKAASIEPEADKELEAGGRMRRIRLPWGSCAHLVVSHAPPLVLFSEVLLRNALAFLLNVDDDVVARVIDHLDSTGERDHGFQLLNNLLDDVAGCSSPRSSPAQSPAQSPVTAKGATEGDGCAWARQTLERMTSAVEAAKPLSRTTAAVLLVDEAWRHTRRAIADDAGRADDEVHVRADRLGAAQSLLLASLGALAVALVAMSMGALGPWKAFNPIESLGALAGNDNGGADGTLAMGYFAL